MKVVRWLGWSVLFAWVGFLAIDFALRPGMFATHVRFVVPNGFRGLVLLVEDSNAPEIPFVGRRHIVRIPPDGVVRVRSARPVLAYEVDLDSWTFEDGTLLPWADGSEAAQLPRDALRAFGGGSTTRDDGPCLFYGVVAEAGDFENVRRGLDDAYERQFPRRR